jgi:autotransporter-associated beta strand protein
MALRYFDRNGTTAGFGTLTGAWDTTTASWTDNVAGTATPATFTFTSADTAQFGATGTTGTAGTATISTGVAVTVNDITTQNLAGLQTIAAAGTGTLTLAGTDPTFDIQSAGGLLVTSPLGGTGGFIKTGTSFLELRGTAKAITGTVTVSAGTLRLAQYAVAGTPDQLSNVETFIINGTLWYSGGTAYTETATITGSGQVYSLNSGVVLTGDTSGFTGVWSAQTGISPWTPGFTHSFFPVSALRLDLENTLSGTTTAVVTHAFQHTTSGSTAVPINVNCTTSGSSGLVAVLATNSGSGVASTFTGAVTKVGASATAALRLAGTNDASSISGVISQGATGALSLQKQGAGKWALSGANTYTGTTTVSAGTLSAQSSSALGPDSSGSGGAISVTGGTLELAGGITLDKSGLNISTVTTASPTNAFQVPVSGGDNTLEVGSITLNSTIRVEVGTDAALRLANTGAISGSTFGITKEGAGELDLNAASNTFTGAVAVNAGTLTVSASCAPSTNGPLGNASSAVVVTGTLKFDGASNSDITRSVQLAGSAPILDASGSSRVHFHAVSQASGSRTIELTGTSTANNQFQSSLADASGGTTGLRKTQTGTWTFTGAPTYTGTTTVSDGLLDFGGQNITLSGGLSANGGIVANGTAGNTMVTGAVLGGGTVQAILDSTSTVQAAASATSRLQPTNATGSNSYTGNTTVYAGGTLELVTAANPATAGNGKVTGASNVTVSGTLATGSGGNQRGQCRYGGNLTFAAGSVLAIGAAA